MRKAVISGVWRWCLGREGRGAPEGMGSSGDAVQEQDRGGIVVGDAEVLLGREQPGTGGMDGGERGEVGEANVGWKDGRKAVGSEQWESETRRDKDACKKC